MVIADGDNPNEKRKKSLEDQIKQAGEQLKLARESDPKSERVFNLQQRINTLKTQKERLAKRISDKKDGQKQDKENEKKREESQCLHKEVSAFADIGMVKTFLLAIGITPKTIAKDEEDYVSVQLKPDMGESEIVKLLTTHLKAAAKRVGKNMGPQWAQKNLTIQWMWDVPGKGQVVYYPSTNKIGFSNQA